MRCGASWSIMSSMDHTWEWRIGGRWEREEIRKRNKSSKISGKGNKSYACIGWMSFISSFTVLYFFCMPDSHVTWSLIPSSRADPGITGFSDLHDKCFPLSLISGMNETVEIVVFESEEWLSSTSVRVTESDSPLNQVIFGFGRDPTDWHLNSILLPAMMELLGGIRRTWSGFTVFSSQVDGKRRGN